MSDLLIYPDQTAINALTPKIGDMVLRDSDSSVLLWTGSIWKEFKPNAFPPLINNQSVSLDGTNEYLSIPDNLTKSLWDTQDWTFSMFIKPDASEIDPADTSIRVFLSGTASSPYIGFRAGVFRYINAGGSGANGPTLTNDWFHVMITNDSSTGSSATSASLYINGSFIGNTRIWQSAQGIRNVGRWYSGLHSASIVDEISIFDSVKQPSDLQNNGVPSNLKPHNPLIWYRCGDDSGDTTQIVKNKGNGGSSLDGALYNTPPYTPDVP